MSLDGLEAASEMMTAWRWFATRWRGIGGVIVERVTDAALARVRTQIHRLGSAG
jgi:hypothetical protein